MMTNFGSSGLSVLRPGATLICLLTGTRSRDIANLIDDNYRFDFKRLVPQLNPGFIAWLEKMVAANVKQRFDNAAAAKAALQSLPSGGKAKLTCVEPLCLTEGNHHN